MQAAYGPKYSEPGAGQGGTVSEFRADDLCLEHLFGAAFYHMAQTYWDNIRKITNTTNVQRIICAGGVVCKTPELILSLERISDHQRRLSLSDDESLAVLLELARYCESRS